MGNPLRQVGQSRRKAEVESRARTACARVRMSKGDRADGRAGGRVVTNMFTGFDPLACVCIFPTEEQASSVVHLWLEYPLSPCAIIPAFFCLPSPRTESDLALVLTTRLLDQLPQAMEEGQNSGRQSCCTWKLFSQELPFEPVSAHATGHYSEQPRSVFPLEFASGALAMVI
ncbi:unnamed protein product [Schistocephalus solidus]|uniref:Uncharacterized protein n=1 Tax=Schistocephalus solidus TaxID=70667 RepID=A0A183SWN8_SCHSO|nr:unnamed protein product [Schistocephalus solidus]